MVATLVFSCKKAAFDRCTAALRHDVVRRTYFTVAYGSDVQGKKKGKQQPGRPRLCSASAMSLANSFISLTLVTRFDIDLHRPLAGSAPPSPLCTSRWYLVRVRSPDLSDAAARGPVRLFTAVFFPFVRTFLNIFYIKIIP